jgi:hypothetical protein
MFNPNQAFLLVKKLKSAPECFTLRVKAEIKYIFSICPKLLINAELYMTLYWPQGCKRCSIKFGKQNFQPLGPMFQHLVIS